LGKTAVAQRRLPASQLENWEKVLFQIYKRISVSYSFSNDTIMETGLGQTYQMVYGLEWTPAFDELVNHKGVLVTGEFFKDLFDENSFSSGNR
jgi:hypothetical protein